MMEISYCEFWIIFISMVFAHIVDDFYLQGILAKLKQKSWWKEHHPEEMYEQDWYVALCMHSVSWSFMIMLPLQIYTHWSISELWFLYPINAFIHGIIDHLKCNKLKISLFTDQMLHLMQIIATITVTLIYLAINT